jgi:hypothetical protein
MVNARPISQYMNGRFYDPVYYAPNDQAAINAATFHFKNEDEFTWGPNNQVFWSSYCFSAAALWNPQVLARPRTNDAGVKTDPIEPFSVPQSLKCPGMSQAAYANLKTHIMEHHWLHNRPDGTPLCNPERKMGTYNGCEPYYFNHSAQSTPMAAFFDGHIAKLSVQDAIESSERVKQQTQSPHGLWSSKLHGTTDGYYENEAVDDTRASFHIYTIDGIKGRDVLSK